MFIMIMQVKKRRVWYCFLMVKPPKILTIRQTIVNHQPQYLNIVLMTFNTRLEVSVLIHSLISVITIAIICFVMKFLMNVMLGTVDMTL